MSVTAVDWKARPGGVCSRHRAVAVAMIHGVQAHQYRGLVNTTRQGCQQCAQRAEAALAEGREAVA